MPSGKAPLQDPRFVQQVSYQVSGEAPPQPRQETAGQITSTAPRQLTVEQALLYTLDNHPRLRARAEEVEVARADLITATLFPNPQFVLDTDSPTDGDPVEIGGRLMFTFPTGGKRERAAAAAKAEIVRAEWAIDSEAHLLLMETAEAALEVLYLQKLVEMQRELTALTRQAAELERQRVEAGAVAGPDALSTEINAVEIEFESLNSEATLAVARVRLSRALGLAQPTDIEVRGDLSMQPLEKLPLAALLNEVAQVRPELAQAEAAITKSRLDVASARAEAIPDVELGPRFSTEMAKGGDSSVGVRLGMELPWFDRKQGDIYEAASQTRANVAFRDEVALNSLHDVANAYLQMRPIEAAVAQYEQKIVPLARQAEALLRDPAAVETIDPVDISNELRKLVQIRLKQLQLRYQHNLIRTQLELLLGRRLSAAPAANESQPLQMPPAEDVAPRVNEQSLRQHGDERQAPSKAPGLLPRHLDSDAGDIGAALQSQTDAAEFLDASNWKPSSNARGGRFRR